MKFNLDNITESKEAFRYLSDLTGKHAIAEVREIKPGRTLNQNSYLHLLIAAFGNHFGYDSEEAKMVYKYLNKDIYMYKRKGLTFWRSSADLTKDEMAKSIDTFMKKSADNGYELPPAIDQAWLQRLSNDLERVNYYQESRHGA